MSYLVILISLHLVNQARSFQNMGATGILRFFLIFLCKQNSFKSIVTTPPHTYTSSRSRTYCWRRWIQLSKWCPQQRRPVLLFILLAYIFPWYLWREKKLWASYADPNPSIIHPRLLRRFNAISCWDDKRFLCVCSCLSRRISWVLPSVMLQLFLQLKHIILYLLVSHIFFIACSFQ